MARARDLIAQTMKDNGITTTVLSETMGYASYRGVERTINREGGMGIKTASRILHYLGYRILAVPDNIEVEGEGVYQLTE